MFDARTKLVTIAAGADGNWTVEGIHYLQSRLPKSATVIARSPTRRLSANEASEFVDNLRRSQLWTTPGWRQTDASHIDSKGGLALWGHDAKFALNILVANAR